MKRFLASFLLFALLLALPSCNREEEYAELGIPSSSRYEAGAVAACPWDLIVKDGVLYIGAGDYDKNAGPITVWGYDIKEKKWVDSGTLPDEELSKFLLLGDTLTIPGTDPQGDWSHGSYYQLENGEWTISESLPDGIHAFDMIEYEGALFAGLGVLPGKSPIVRSTDGGNRFSPVVLKKNGEAVDTSLYETVRVYDFFLCDGELYALFINGNETLSFDIFHYTEGAFVYTSNIRSQVGFLNVSGKLIQAKATFKDKLFFTTGHLYSTGDMDTFTPLLPPHATVVYDLLTDGGRLYVLSAEKAEEGYRISVSSSKTGEADDFKEEFYFYYSAPPLSFAKNGRSFYIGMGSKGEANDKNGMILQIDS